MVNYVKFVLPCYLINVLHLENMDGLEPNDGLHPDGSAGSEIVHGAYDILKIPSEVYELLEKNNFFNGVKRGFGQFLYSIIDVFLSMMDNVFKALISFDFNKIEIINGMNVRITDVAYSIMIIAVIVILFLNLLKMKNSLSIIYNICVASFCISAFVPIVNFMQNIQRAGIQSVDYIVGTTENDNLSDTVFKSNTIDILQTMKTCSDEGDIYVCDIRNVDSNANAKYIEYDLLLDSDIIGDTVESYTVENGQGKRVRVKMSDGILGIGKERYYSYKINYMYINITCIALLLIYFLGLFKMAYLLAEEIQIIMTARPVMALSINDVKRISLVLTSLAKNFAGQIIVYFTMCFFGIITSTMGANQLTGNWLADAFIMLGIGMAFLVGSTYLNNALGIDDGSGFMMKSMFAMGRFGRMFRPLKKGVGKIGNATKNEINDLKEEYDYGKNRGDLAGITEESLKGSAEQKYQEEEMLKQQGDIPEEARTWEDGTKMTEEEYQEQKLSDPNYVNKWHELQDVKKQREQEKENKHLESLNRKAEEQRAMNQFRHDQWREQDIKDGKIKEQPKYKELENLSGYDEMKKINPSLQYRPAPKNFKELYKLNDEEQEQFKNNNWEEYETTRVKNEYQEMLKKDTGNSQFDNDDLGVISQDDEEIIRRLRSLGEKEEKQKRDEAEWKTLNKKIEFSNFKNGIKGELGSTKDNELVNYALKIPKEKQEYYNDIDSVVNDYKKYKGGKS